MKHTTSHAAILPSVDDLDTGRLVILNIHANATVRVMTRKDS